MTIESNIVCYRPTATLPMQSAIQLDSCDQAVCSEYKPSGGVYRELHRYQIVYTFIDNACAGGSLDKVLAKGVAVLKL